MSLLTLVQETCDLLGITRPTTVANSTDLQIRQLVALANEEGDELSRAPDQGWEVLKAEHTFVTVAAEAQPNAVPADLRSFIPNTFYNRTTRRELIGPISPQEWQAIKAQPALNRVYLCFRERGGQFLVTPAPAAGETIAFEYVSRNWVQAADGTFKNALTLDNDAALLPEKLMKLGLRWRWLKSKGLDYAEDFRTYEAEKQKRIGQDGGAGVLSSIGRTVYGGARALLPEGNFPGP